jgi:metal-responsive CopG/Arc/MetJ family transcriptional regulator
MKVAISVPDRLSQAADKAARRMRVPRSQLYARAVEAYLKRGEAQDVTARLNAVHGDASAERDVFVEKAARTTLRRSRW